MENKPNDWDHSRTPHLYFPVQNNEWKHLSMCNIKQLWPLTLKAEVYKKAHGGWLHSACEDFITAMKLDLITSLLGQIKEQISATTFPLWCMTNQTWKKKNKHWETVTTTTKQAYPAARLSTTRQLLTELRSEFIFSWLYFDRHYLTLLLHNAENTASLPPSESQQSSVFTVCCSPLSTIIAVQKCVKWTQWTKGVTLMLNVRGEESASTLWHLSFITDITMIGTDPGARGTKATHIQCSTG